MKTLILLFFSAGWLLIFNSSYNSNEAVVVKEKKSLEMTKAKQLSPKELTENKNGKISILIEKSKYRLSLMNDDVVVKTYPVVFGANPTDDKLCEGDKCTPEGSFYIQSKYHHKKWSRFMLISYPNSDSEKKFKLAKKNGIIPANATIGGSVGIHGVPKGFDFCIALKTNWTKGCIAMRNADVIELYSKIPQNTEVRIVH